MNRTKHHLQTETIFHSPGRILSVCIRFGHLHHGEAEDKGNGEPFGHCVVSVVEPPGETHDQRHVHRHDDTSDPKGLSTTP